MCEIYYYQISTIICFSHGLHGRCRYCVGVVLVFTSSPCHKCYIKSEKRAKTPGDDVFQT